MNRKQRVTITVALFWTVVISVPGLWLWREDRQQNLNLQLITAVKQEDAALSLDALKQGADANTRDEHRDIPAWLRIWNLLQGRRLPPSTDRTPLLIALQNRDLVGDSGISFIRQEYPDVVSTLLSHGARANAADMYGRTPLFYALFENKIATARLLIEHGADVTVESDRESLLLAAIRYANDPATVELLLQHGADPNKASPENLTPLALAIVRNDPAAVQSLLRRHADIHSTTALADGLKPLQYAEKHHMTEIAKMLRDVGTAPQKHEP